MPFAPKETTTGGKALKFYASVRIEVRKIGSLKQQEEHIGNRVQIKVAKNKVAPPFKVAEVDLLFNEGICKELDLLDMALQLEVVGKAGAWFSFEGANVAQGREQALHFLRTNKEVADRIEGKVFEKLAAQQTHINHTL